MSGEKGTQYYHDKVTTLFDGYYSAEDDEGKPTAKERNSASNALIDLYVEATEKRPPASVISRLATYILLDDLTDSHPDKMAREEYPIMSYGQTGRHFKRNLPVHDLQYDIADVRGYVSGNCFEGDGTRDEIMEFDLPEYREVIWQTFILDVLTEREAFIVREVYENGATQSEIAADIGISQQRVATILSGVYDKLRDLIDDYSC